MPSEDLLSHQVGILKCILFCFSFDIGKWVPENTILWIIGKIINQNGQLKEDHAFQKGAQKLAIPKNFSANR